MEKIMKNRLQMWSLTYWMLVIWLATNGVFELVEGYKMRANQLLPGEATKHLWTALILGIIMVVVSFVYAFLRGTMLARVGYLEAHRKKSQRLTGKRGQDYTVLSDRNKVLILVLFTGTQIGRIFFGANTLRYLWVVGVALVILLIYWLTEVRSLGLKKEPKPIMEKRADGRRAEKQKKEKKPGLLKRLGRWLGRLFGTTSFESDDEHDGHDYDQEGYKEKDRRSRSRRGRYVDPEEDDSEEDNGEEDNGEEDIFGIYERDPLGSEAESNGSDADGDSEESSGDDSDEDYDGSADEDYEDGDSEDGEDFEDSGEDDESEEEDSEDEDEKSWPV